MARIETSSPPSILPSSSSISVTSHSGYSSCGGASYSSTSSSLTVVGGRRRRKRLQTPSPPKTRQKQPGGNAAPSPSTSLSPPLRRTWSKKHGTSSSSLSLSSSSSATSMLRFLAVSPSRRTGPQNGHGHYHERNGAALEHGHHGEEETEEHGDDKVHFSKRRIRSYSNLHAWFTSILCCRSHPKANLPPRSTTKRFSTLSTCFLFLATLFCITTAISLLLHGRPSLSSLPFSVPPQFHTTTNNNNKGGPPVIHIVNTRFMQEQAHLLHLAQARLLLFEAFCLPTMISQTLQQQQSTSPPKFLWIIKTDPNLNPAIRQRLVDLLSPHENFYLVASLKNFGVGKQVGSWRGGEAGLEILHGGGGDAVGDQNATDGNHEPPALYTGKREWLQWAHQERQRRIVIETRLDADDGLPLDYLQEVQERALEEFSGVGGGGGAADKDSHEEQDHKVDSSQNTKKKRAKEAVHQQQPKDPQQAQLEQQQQRRRRLHTPTDVNQQPQPQPQQIRKRKPSNNHRTAQWKFWCMSESINWYPSILHDGGFYPYGPLPSPDDPGLLQVDDNNGKVVCLTPGLSLGLAVGVPNEAGVPKYSHYDLLHELAVHPFAEENNCGLKRAELCAVVMHSRRAVRSRTPTSAGMKHLAPVKEEKKEFVKEQWEFLREVYGIEREDAYLVNRHIHEHLVEVLRDNMKGQCTKGHSCKESSKVLLRKMLDKAEEAEKERMEGRFQD